MKKSNYQYITIVNGEEANSGSYEESEPYIGFPDTPRSYSNKNLSLDKDLELKILKRKELDNESSKSLNNKDISINSNEDDFIRTITGSNSNKGKRDKDLINVVENIQEVFTNKKTSEEFFKNSSIEVENHSKREEKSIISANKLNNNEINKNLVQDFEKKEWESKNSYLPSSQNEYKNTNKKYTENINSEEKFYQFSPNISKYKFNLLPRDFSIYDTQKLKYYLNKEIARTKPSNKEKFIDRMMFDIFKRQTKENRIDILVTKNRVKIAEEDKVNTFNRLIDDANRRLEANEKMTHLKSHLDRLSSSQETCRRTDSNQWDKIYTERFLNYKNEKTQSIEIKKRLQIEELIEKENEILDYVKKKTKKVSKNEIKQISERLYEESQRRSIIKEHLEANKAKINEEKKVSQKKYSKKNLIYEKGNLLKEEKIQTLNAKPRNRLEFVDDSKKNSKKFQNIKNLKGSISQLIQLKIEAKTGNLSNTYVKNKEKKCISSGGTGNKAEKNQDKYDYFQTCSTTPKENTNPQLIDMKNNILKKTKSMKIQDHRSLYSFNLVNSFEKVDQDNGSLLKDIDDYQKHSTSRDFSYLNNFSNMKFLTNSSKDRLSILNYTNINKNEKSLNEKLSYRKSVNTVIKSGEYNQYIPDKTADLIVKNILKNKLS